MAKQRGPVVPKLDRKPRSDYAIRQDLYQQLVAMNYRRAMWKLSDADKI